jgi:protocatechuate 3,4-dioxygenase, alpha subunit
MSNSLLPPTTAQTIGPFFHDALLRADARIQILRTPATIGEPIRIEGCVFDGDGIAVPDAMIEIWQANAAGRYNHLADTRALPLDPTFTGYGRTATDTDGNFWFETIKPGLVPFNATTLQAPHINIAIFGRGLLNHLYTRLYFAQEPANASDLILQRVAAARRHTLIAIRSEQPGIGVYRFEIRLQGNQETVFFNLSGGM